jgi:hypothetical protein
MPSFAKKLDTAQLPPLRPPTYVDKARMSPAEPFVPFCRKAWPDPEIMARYPPPLELSRPPEYVKER